MRSTSSCLLALAVLSCGDKTPSVPILNGAARGRPGDTLAFYVLSVDPEQDSLSYRFDWGDGSVGEWSVLQPPGTEYYSSHAFGDTGRFGVRAQVRDLGHESEWCDSHQVSIEEYGPFIPHQPLNQGPDTVVVGDTVEVATTAGHPLGERVAIQLTWDDSIGDWSPFVDAGYPVTERRSFAVAGDHEVRARAKDSLEHLSDWSHPCSVRVVDSLGR